MRHGEVGWLRSPLITYDGGQLIKHRNYLGIFKVVILDFYKDDETDTGLVGYQHLDFQGLPYYSNAFRISRNFSENYFSLFHDRDEMVRTIAFNEHCEHLSFRFNKKDYHLGFKTKKEYLEGGWRQKLIGGGNPYLDIIQRFNCWIVQMNSSIIGNLLHGGFIAPIGIESMTEIDIREYLTLDEQILVNGFIHNLKNETTLL
jgi:hypothetical protein